MLFFYQSIKKVVKLNFDSFAIISPPVLYSFYNASYGPTLLPKGLL
jgi:hypothetical protein